MRTREKCTGGGRKIVWPYTFRNTFQKCIKEKETITRWQELFYPRENRISSFLRIPGLLHFAQTYLRHFTDDRPCTNGNTGYYQTTVYRGRLCATEWKSMNTTGMYIANSWRITPGPRENYAQRRERDDNHMTGVFFIPEELGIPISSFLRILGLRHFTWPYLRYFTMPGLAQLVTQGIIRLPPEFSESESPPPIDARGGGGQLGFFVNTPMGIN